MNTILIAKSILKLVELHNKRKWDAREGFVYFYKIFPFVKQEIVAWKVEVYHLDRISSSLWNYSSHLDISWLKSSIYQRHLFTFSHFFYKTIVILLICYSILAWHFNIKEMSMTNIMSKHIPEVLTYFMNKHQIKYYPKCLSHEKHNSN